MHILGWFFSAYYISLYIVVIIFVLLNVLGLKNLKMLIGKLIVQLS